MLIISYNEILHLLDVKASDVFFELRQDVIDWMDENEVIGNLENYDCGNGDLRALVFDTEANCMAFKLRWL